MARRLMLGIVLQVYDDGCVYGSDGSSQVMYRSKDASGMSTSVSFKAPAVDPFSRQSDSQCHICLKVFHGDKRKYRLGRHMVTHTGERRFPCTKCPYKANQKEHLNRHMKSKHFNAL